MILPFKTTNNLTVTGDVSATGFYYGDGSRLTGINSGGGGTTTLSPYTTGTGIGSIQPTLSGNIASGKYAVVTGGNSKVIFGSTANITSGIQAYWKLDNDGSGAVSLVDSTGNSNTLTNYNSVTLGTGVIAGDAVFNATNYLTGPSNLVSSGDFSVSFWFKLNTAGDYTLFESAGTLNIMYTGGAVVANNTLVGNGIAAPVDINTWYHLCLSCESGTSSLYINGVLNGSTTQELSLLGVIGLGAYVPYGQYYLDGSIDEVGVWNRALLLSEIQALYNNGTGVTYPFPSFPSDGVDAYWKLDNNGTGGISLVDSTGNGYSLTNNNVATLASGIINGGAQFSVIDSSTLTSSLAVGSSYSISCWVKANDFDGGVCAWSFDSPNAPALVVAGSTIYFFAGNNGGGDVNIGQGLNPPSTGSWYHCVATVDYANNAATFYIDGAYVDSVTTSGNMGGWSGFIIGAYPQRGIGTINGVVDEVGIWNRVLTLSEIQTLYNNGTGLSYSAGNITLPANIASGDYTFIANGWSNNTNNKENTYILGSNITAISANYTYVNNLSSLGLVTAASGNSNQWNDTYTTVQSNSASWDSKRYITGGGFESIVPVYGSNTASGYVSNVGGGELNTADGSRSNVGGGYNNITLGGGSNISGGHHNTASGNYSGVGGGWCNTASGTYSSVVAGGSFNTASAGYSSVAGGGSNISSGEGSNVAGGVGNIASGVFSSVLGGYCNTAIGNYSTVVGGFSGSAIGYTTFVGTGSGNRASGSYTAVVGGVRNTASGCYSVIGGGRLNTITSTSVCGFIGGGFNNTINTNAGANTISGGYGNTIAPGGDNSTIGGGKQNIACGQYVTIAGGWQNCACFVGSVVGGGNANCAIATRTVVAGGRGNTASGVYANVNGGHGNFNPLRDSIIGGGVANHTGGFTPVGVTNTSLSGNGTQTRISFNGIQNCFSSPFISNNVSVYYGSALNPLSAGCFTTATIAATGSNFIIINGDYSTCTPSGLSATNIFVYDRCINNNGTSNTIVGGKLNTASGCYGFIGGGFNNTVGPSINNTPASFSTIVGGCCNTASAYFATIAGGHNNFANCRSAVVGGSSNSASGYASFVGGGQSNCSIGRNSAVVGGSNNCPTGGCAFIGAGGANVASGDRSGIVSGRNNTTSGSYSIIGAGRFNYNPLFGSNIVGGLYNHTGGFTPNNITTASISGNGICTVLIQNGIGSRFSPSNTTGAVSLIWMTSGTANQSLTSANITIANVVTNAANCIIINGDYSTCRPNGLSACNVWVYDRCLNNAGCLNFIGGGILNTASSCYNFIGGGCLNSIPVGSTNSIVGGHCNTNCGPSNSTIAGGQLNTITGTGNYAFIAGGRQNTVSNWYSSVIGGSFNFINGQNSIAGGQGNCVPTSNAAIVAGRCNTTNGFGSFIGAGTCNNITSSGTYASVVGGRFNHNPLYGSNIVGGLYNHTGGFTPNNITTAAFISGNGSCTVLIQNGIGSCFSASSTSGAVSLIWTTSGTANQSLSSACFAIANVVTNAANCIIINGDYSTCTSTGLSACNIFVYDRCLNSTGCSNTIGGGVLNTASSCYNFIGGGIRNTTSGSYSFIGGGGLNVTTGCSQTIAGGRCNRICVGNFNSILGGINNSINSPAGDVNTILGGSINAINSGTRNTVSGYFNCITGGSCSVVLGGRNNTSSGGFNFIGAGCLNLASGVYSTVVGGFRNTASGAYSFVAGGSANDTRGFANTFILGTGLSASAANYTYVNNLSSAGAIEAAVLKISTAPTAFINPLTASNSFLIINVNGSDKALQLWDFTT